MKQKPGKTVRLLQCLLEAWRFREEISIHEIKKHYVICIGDHLNVLVGGNLNVS